MSQLLLGIFHGVARRHKSIFDVSAGPDHIVLYQKNIEAMCSNDEKFAITLIHELGHYFGMSEEQLRDV